MADWPHSWTTGRCSVASRSRVQSLPSQKPNKSASALFLLIVLVDDFEIAKRATLLFSRENDFFELDDRNNLSTNMKQETDPGFFFFFFFKLNFENLKCITETGEEKKQMLKKMQDLLLKISASLTSATGDDLRAFNLVSFDNIRNTPRCDSSTCVYESQYVDSSFSVGFFGAEKLTLTSTDAFNNIYFGCGQNNQGLFGGSAGILGLGRHKLSLVSQTAQKYNKIFSYCLPYSSSSTGFLTFGGSASKNSKFTPLSTISAGPSFYGLDFTGISVGGTKLAISASVFSTAGAIIDSGTVISRLPPAAYSALRASFRNLMSNYPLTSALGTLDTCYDLSSYSTISVPNIGFFFSNGIEVDIDLTGIFYASSLSQVCLAFAGNSNATDLLVFGNVQQTTLEVFYDGSAGKVGFANRGL
ncbi:hypothetical protein DKX38_027709 [Salix brachista]|uniref:Peptidase A1 domain-containing protein n=1 Tax=Salix brachista TaxID=2182728 RepID=A0A5N5J901_9ROSI|nr:hypothetical protein DKX38_027709 [Salix brachista]